MVQSVNGFERRHVLVLFAFGIVSRGMFKSLLGTNGSLLLVLSVALLYWYLKRKNENIYDDIARMQAEAAAKIDALHGLGDGTVTKESMASRPTQFQLDENDRAFVTERMHRYSSKMAGSRSDRRKFLRKRVKYHTSVDGSAITASVDTEPAPAVSQSPSRRTKKIVEEAIHETL